MVGVVGLLDGRCSSWLAVDQRNHCGDEKHQSRDGQDEFGLADAWLRLTVFLAGAAVLLEFVVEGLQADAQNLGGARLVLARGFQRAQDE